MGGLSRSGVALASAVVVTVLGVAVWWWVTAGPYARPDIERGKQLAVTYCGVCHIQPPPEILPKRSWEAALGYMGFWLGMEDLSFLADHPEAVRINVESRHEILLRDKLFPSAPLLTEEDWATLRSYYLSMAPNEALSQVGKPELQWELGRFDAFRTSYRPTPIAVTTLVAIHESAEEVFIGDTAGETLTVLGGDGRVKGGPRRFRPPISPVDLEFVGDTAYLASIGDLMGARPGDAPLAHIDALELVDGSLANATSRVVLGGLLRMADMKPVDLNGDGRLDFIVCSFGGSATGNLAWYEALPDGKFAEHVLMNRPGAVKVEVHDFNGDGLLDIVALLADAREGLYVLENLGAGEFRAHTVFETHPAYGHTFLDLNDFDGDGRMDVLVVNGDNIDSDPYNTRKNYHGLRIYLNRGDYAFELAYFYPMYGAFIAKAADFDADGDVDIAAIAFYPDFAAERRESFTYLQNEGGLDFSAHSSEDVMGGRWMTMDIGDIDGDDDIDVVLGGSYVPVGMIAYQDLYEQLARTGPAVLILKNTLN
jgi:hypothetical protein